MQLTLLNEHSQDTGPRLVLFHQTHLKAAERTFSFALLSTGEGRNIPVEWCIITYKSKKRSLLGFKGIKEHIIHCIRFQSHLMLWNVHETSF